MTYIKVARLALEDIKQREMAFGKYQQSEGIRQLARFCFYLLFILQGFGAISLKTGPPLVNIYLPVNERHVGSLKKKKLPDSLLKRGFNKEFTINT